MTRIYTNHAELIAEAEKRAAHLEKFAWMAERDADREEMREDAAQLRRLAAALRECAVPDGCTPCMHEWNIGGGGILERYPSGVWAVRNKFGHHVYKGENWVFPTASAAMAALDGGE